MSDYEERGNCTCFMDNCCMSLCQCKSGSTHMQDHTHNEKNSKELTAEIFIVNPEELKKSARKIGAVNPVMPYG